MRNRTTLLIVAVVVLALLALGTTAGAMALSRGGMWGNGNGYGMMNGQQGYQGMMGGQYNRGNMMGGQYNRGNMMGGYQQTPGAQSNPVTGVTHMNMQNFAYQYTNIQVRAGTTVTWTNQDSAPHSITFKNGMKDSGLLSQGQSFSYTFNTPGAYQYYCSVHPNMVATVTVVS